MSSIKRLMRANRQRLVITTLCALAFLALVYLSTGIARGLGKRAAIYQLFFPNTFYSVLALVNVCFVTMVQPYANILEQVRFSQKDGWFKTVITWIILSCLWTALLASIVMQVLLLLQPGINGIYWQPLLLTIVLAFENFLFFQSIILLVYLLAVRVNYFFVNCLVYVLIMGTLNTIFHNQLLEVFFGSQFLIQGKMVKLGLQSLFMWGVMLLSWCLSWELFIRRERL